MIPTITLNKDRTEIEQRPNRQYPMTKGSTYPCFILQTSEVTKVQSLISYITKATEAPGL